MLPQCSTSKSGERLEVSQRAQRSWFEKRLARSNGNGWR
jgi:hypothetical protein